MAQTQINGGTQIRAGTISLAALVTGYSVPTANLADGANFLKKDGTVALTAAINLGGFAALNSGAPVNASDVTTKAYVDAKTAGIGGWHGVRILAIANVAALTGLAATDGVTPVAGDLILCVAQTTAAQNGPWVAAAGSWARPSWWSGAVNEGQYFLVAEGTTYKDTKWFCTTTGAITVDTTATTFTQDTSGATYTAGTGLGLAGNAFSVNYGTAAGTAAQGNDTRITGALQTSALGTGVATALGVAVGTGAGLAALSGGYLQAGDFPALTGDVTTVAGALATTINNTAGTGFTKYTNNIVGEIPSGTINGSNATFTLAHTPSACNSGASSLRLHMDGVRLTSGVGNDYTIATNTITMLNVPQTGDTLIADYLF